MAKLYIYIWGVFVISNIGESVAGSDLLKEQTINQNSSSSEEVLEIIKYRKKRRKPLQRIARINPFLPMIQDNIMFHPREFYNMTAEERIQHIDERYRYLWVYRNSLVCPFSNCFEINEPAIKLLNYIQQTEETHLPKKKQGSDILPNESMKNTPNSVFNLLNDKTIFLQEKKLQQKK